MRLLDFKYLRPRRMVTLILILVSASALFSLTAFSLFGFYRGFEAYLGESEDIVAVYDRSARTPLTGLIPAYLAERIAVKKGVLAVSPETIAPILMRDQPIILRGIIPDEFTRLNPLDLADGEMLQPGDTGSIIVGRALAGRLRLRPGDKALALGVLADRYLELTVKGIFKSQSMADDEVLSPLHVGQWLRGTDYSHVSVIRIKLDKSSVSRSLILEEIAKEATEPASSEIKQQRPLDSLIASGRIPFRIEDIGVEEARGLMDSYLERYGVTKETLLVLSATVFMLSGASIAAASRTIILQHKGEIEVLRSIGASQNTIKKDILAKLLPYSLTSSAVGITFAATIFMTIQRNGYLQMLSHNIPFELDLSIVALGLILSSLLVAASILGSRLR